MAGAQQALAPVARAMRVPATSHLDHPVPDMGRVPGLDGVRAIAVAGVLLYHGNSSWLPGGFLGVDVFFVLSGFLITTILLQSLQGSGRVDFKRFYVHRARRLVPALLATLLLAAILVVVFARDAASQFRADVLPSMFYVANWGFIVQDQSYFEAMGRAPLLQHLWSLAVEEQFYLLWPLAVFGLFRWRGRAGVGRVALFVAAGSTLLMAFLAVWWNLPASGDASRLYFGTDTHCMGLLLGAALGAVWRPGALPRSLPRPRAAALTSVGVAGLAVVLACYVWMTDTGDFLYRGGFAVVSIGAAVLIAVVTHPAAFLAPVLALKPLEYVGTRSYGLYLYHWPIFAVTRPNLDLPYGGVWAFATSLALTFAVAEASYRFLEHPIRTVGWRATWGQWTSRASSPTVARRWAVGATAGVVALAALVAVIPAPSAKDFLGGVTEVGTGALEPSPSPSASLSASASASPSAADRTTPVPLDAPITAVGDSVLLGAAPGLQPTLPGLTVDAAISRQPSEVFDRVLERRDAGQLSDVVIVQAGTNGEITQDGLRAFLTSLSDRRRVVLLTTSASSAEPWQAASDEAIYAVAPEFPNVRLADWAVASEGHGDYFVYDGVHLDDAGIVAYRELIKAALQSN